MQMIKTFNWILIIGMTMLFSSCIERYFPEATGGFKPRIVINGTLNSENGEQEVVISESTSPENPKFVPLSGCTVTVEDDQGDSFPFIESAEDPGHYRATINGYYVAIGWRYRLSVKTPQGKQYVSSFEKMLACPDVDSVYYELASKPTSDPDVDENGLQFYLDFKADDSYGHYFRWEVIETYEYHSTFPLERWTDDEGYHDLIVPDSSNFFCYKTANVGSIFLLSTKGFTENRYNRYKLHFVNDRTQRLLHQYSLLVKQYSISKDAYNYWLNLKENNQESINLFTKQPANVKGNIYNVNDTTDRALGYFGVTAGRSKRIMIKSVEGLSFDQVPYCKVRPLQGPVLPDQLPLYFASYYNEVGERVSGVTNPDCIFCQMHGGTTEKPPYWDNWN